MWLSKPACLDVVKKVWDKEDLHTDGSDAAQKEISRLNRDDMAAGSRSHVKALEKELDRIHGLEEQYWKQRSRIWLKEGQEGERLFGIVIKK
ncbi:hypothetical protein PanWU01x14_139530 [Parasponia andersonii]|uniref:Uncharacterized protein n=1 Tax=Parasponia andersonii TaxID=3476 RepID=A0A2P5CMJ1_PARAD|nr:hypothetical protein PanWU01x14_139530 [Parasponia andersonii]